MTCFNPVLLDHRPTIVLHKRCLALKYFVRNFLWARSFLQMTMTLCEPGMAGYARALKGTILLNKNNDSIAAILIKLECSLGRLKIG